jgi:hypothetical protein
MPMSLTTYQARVDKAVERWLLFNQVERAMANVAIVLGNPDVGRPGVPASDGASEVESIVRKAWVTIFEKSNHANGQIWLVERHILKGILVNNRWLDFMRSEQLAHDFVRLCARHLWLGAITQTSPPIEADPNTQINKMMRSAFAPWLPPESAVDLFTRRDLSRMFFGEAWCILVFDLSPENLPLASLIELTQPNFLPGWVAEELAHPTDQLPSFDE